MTATRRLLCGKSARHSAFSLVEAAVSVVLIGGLLVVTLNAVGGAVRGRVKLGERARGALLAEDLMTEILNQKYEEPVDTPTFGREGSESGGDRALYDDVDDYEVWDSTPPEYSDGTALAGLNTWRRLVTVEWVDPTALGTVLVSDSGAKRITVSVYHGYELMTQLVSVKTAGLPPPNPYPGIMFVVADVATLTSQEQAREDLFTSWGYTSIRIASSATQADFDTATADVLAAYVPSCVLEAELSTKLRIAAIGVVNGDAELTDEFGFSSSRSYTGEQEVYITSELHYITGVLTQGWIATYASSQQVHLVTGTIAAQMTQLGRAHSGPGPNSYLSFGTLQPGDDLVGGGLATGRRVQLPWGGAAFDINSLTADAQTILQRSIEWAAGLDTP